MFWIQIYKKLFIKQKHFKCAAKSILENYLIKTHKIKMDQAAASYWINKEAVRDWIFEHFDENSKILDVGAGCGTYSSLLAGRYKNIDAVEVYYPNIIDYELLKKYRSVAYHDIVGLEYPCYDLVIFGDVLEHLSVENAQAVLAYASQNCREIIVAVPYTYVQEGNENQYERHIQDDLTQENMLERYPMLEPLFIDSLYGYYKKKSN